jgi:hypothetical protein
LELPGCGGPGKIQFLKNLLLSETKSSARRAAHQLLHLAGYHWHIVPSMGLSRGLWLLWTESLKVTVLESTRFYIFAMVENRRGEDWVLGAIYGNVSHRYNPIIWERIRVFTDEHQASLCCIGDFNAIPCMSEKYGGSHQMNSNNRAFCNLLRTSNLIDLGYSGPAFTWTNTQFESNPIFQRLNRIIVSSSWQEIFPMAHVKHLPMLYSDHAPILLRTTPTTKFCRVFKLENWWLTLKGFDEECRRLWKQNQHLSWEQRRRKLGMGLQKWARNYPSSRKILEQIETEILQVQSIHPRHKNFAEERRLQHQHDIAQNQLELMWHERSRVNWLSFGDRNTHFFHHMATIRRRQNQILSLQKEDGTWTETEPPLLEFELLPWLVDVFSVVNLGSTKIRRLVRDAHHFCRQVHGRNLHRNKIHGI